MARPPHPPRVARLLASLVLYGEAFEVITGDLDQEFAEAIAGGMRPGAARRRYWRQTLASIAAVKRDARERRRDAQSRALLFQGVSLDLKSVTRVLRRSPGYAAIAVLSLAIGIGANTTIFSVVRQLLLMPLPVETPEDLRLVYWSPHRDGPLGISNISASSFTDGSGVSFRSNFSYPQFSAMRDAASGSASIAAYTFVRRLTVSADRHGPILASGMLASGNFFSTVRPPLVLGRGLTERDDNDAAPPVAVISQTLWTHLFGNDLDIRGKTMRVNDAIVEVIGVTAPVYRGLSQGGFIPATDVTIALAKQALISPEWSRPGTSLFTAPGAYWVRLIARTSAASEARAYGVLRTAFAGQIAQGGLTPAIAATSTLAMFPGARGIDSLRTSPLLPLRILSIVSGVVLLIACINVAGLMLARGVSRQHELTIRRALGAGRARIMRELLLESVILSGIGGLAGLLVALWIAPVLQSMLASGLGTSGISVSLDWPLIGATAVLACTAGILAGLLPAIRFSRNADAMLKHRTASGAPRLLAGRVLLALQIAVSLPLVVGAGLFLRTLNNYAGVDLGFEPRGLMLFNLDPTMSGKAPERTAQVMPRLLERIEAIPGVTSATPLENALMAGSGSSTTMTVDGRDAEISYNAVGPHYLETMGIRLVAGRMLRPTDSAGPPSVVVINQTLADRFFKSTSPIGGRMKGGLWDVTVVGVVTDSKYEGLRNAVEPTMLQSYLQRTEGRFTVGAMTVAVRSTVSSAAMRAAIEAAVHDVDPTIPLAEFRTQQEQIDQMIGRERVIATLLTAFGGFALLLACVGLHGVTAYSVARRTSEIGIRLALGAQRAQVLWLVLRQVVILAIAGLAIGLPIAWIAGPLTGPMLFGLDPRDPVTIAAAAAILALFVVVAGLRPARRAARLEALTALRTE
jgi:predicted permease